MTDESRVYAISATRGESIAFEYVNESGQIENRTAEIGSIVWANLTIDRGPTWYLMAFDLDRKEWCSFIMSDMRNVKSVLSLK